MKLHRVVECSKDVARLSGRNEKVQRLADLLEEVAPDEIEIALGMLTGVPRQGRIGIGPAALRTSWGETAEAGSLDIREVDEVFQRIADQRGPGSATAKLSMLGALFQRTTLDERDFLIRLLMGELRQGALEGVMIEAVALASKVQSEIVRRALMATGDLGEVARAALTEGATGLTGLSIQLLRPVAPMLATVSDGVGDALGRLGTAALEYKLDGARIQVHKAGDEVRIFSRRLRDVTAAIPEIVERVRTLPVREAILDGEVLALQSDGTPQPFQVTMRRFGRKLDVARLRTALPVTPFVFDLLYLDGGDLTDERQARRFDAMAGVVPSSWLIPRIVTSSERDAKDFLWNAIGDGHEGIMVKALEATYEAGSRGQTWLKIKPAHTLDLVVLAAEWGHGRRRGWLSNLHLGARNPRDGSFVMLGKTFKGMTDAMLAWQTDHLLTLEVSRDRYTVYVRPELVVEVAFNGLQESTQYPGGLALRFARIKRYRTDKHAADADTMETVRALHRDPIGQWRDA